jgi:hypothetical protein
VRFLIINTDYSQFLDWLYANHRGLERQSYSEQCRVRNATFFGLSDVCSNNLQSLGHEAWDVYINNEFTQKAWAREHDIPVDQTRWQGRLRRGVVPWVSRMPVLDWFAEVVCRQAAEFKPDVILNLAMDGIDASVLGQLKSHTRLLVGQHAAPLTPRMSPASYDLVLSSLPNLVDRFRREGLRSEYLRLAFDPRVLDHVAEIRSSVDVSFVGSLSPHHQSRLKLIRAIAAATGIELWGPPLDGFAADDVLHRHYKGIAWALDMYAVLRRSRITINHHIDMAGDHANNMRLYEATGAGTLLLTDAKSDLQDIFVPGREVATYRTPEECADIIAHYLSHEDQRAAVARAGQQRTLRDHTYRLRMEELSALTAASV